MSPPAQAEVQAPEFTDTKRGLTTNHGVEIPSEDAPDYLAKLRARHNMAVRSTQEASARMAKADDVVEQGIWHNVLLSKNLEMETLAERIRKGEVAESERKLVVKGMAVLSGRGIAPAGDDPLLQLYQVRVAKGEDPRQVANEMWPAQAGMIEGQQLVGREAVLQEARDAGTIPSKTSGRMTPGEQVDREVKVHELRTDAVETGKLPPPSSGRDTPEQSAARQVLKDQAVEGFTGRKAEAARKQAESAAFTQLNKMLDARFDLDRAALQVADLPKEEQSAKLSQIAKEGMPFDPASISLENARILSAVPTSRLTARQQVAVEQLSGHYGELLDQPPPDDPPASRSGGDGSKSGGGPSTQLEHALAVAEENLGRPLSDDERSEVTGQIADEHYQAWREANPEATEEEEVRVAREILRLYGLGE